MKTFLVVLLIAVVGYGVFMTALLFPDSPPSWNVLFHVIFRPYLLMFGEMGLEQYERKWKTLFTRSTYPPCYSTSFMLGF